VKIAKKTAGKRNEKPLTMKERAKKARREVYLRAKERMKKDPRTIEFKAKMKEARRGANKAAKERRKTDPKQIALKAKLKQGRQEATKSAKEQQKAQTGATKRAERVGKDARLMVNVASADTLASPPVETSAVMADRHREDANALEAE
jgi:hypothetical protein